MKDELMNTGQHEESMSESFALTFAEIDAVCLAGRLLHLRLPDFSRMRFAMARGNRWVLLGTSTVAGSNGAGILSR